MRGFSVLFFAEQSPFFWFIASQIVGIKVIVGHHQCARADLTDGFERYGDDNQDTGTTDRQASAGQSGDVIDQIFSDEWQDGDDTKRQ